MLVLFQTCDIRAEGGKRFLTLKNVQLDQAGEVSYQALNAVTTAMLTVKGKMATSVCVYCLLSAFSVVRCLCLSNQPSPNVPVMVGTSQKFPWVLHNR